MSLPVSVAYGTTRTTDEEAYKNVCEALEAGYRVINTCAAYGNEQGMGRAIRGAARDELTIVSLDSNTGRSSEDAEHFDGYQATERQINETLENLGVEYVDYFLINWPVPRYMENVWRKLNADSWRALEDFVDRGLIRHIGVSNFLPYHLEELKKTARLPIELNQLELHPTFQQRETVNYSRKHGMDIIAWSPLFKGRSVKIPEIIAMAERYGKTPAQVILRWHLQHKVVPVVCSSNRERMRSNLGALDFELSDEDMMAIDNLETGEHVEAYSYTRQQNSVK